jgi:hypothetical protein
LPLPPPLLCISPHPPPPRPFAAALQVFCAGKICCWRWLSQPQPPRPPRVGRAGSTRRSQPQQQEAAGSPPAPGRKASGHSRLRNSSSPASGCGGVSWNLKDSAGPPNLHSYPSFSGTPDALVPLGRAPPLAEVSLQLFLSFQW